MARIDSVRHIIRRIRRRFGLPYEGAAHIYLLHFVTPLGHAKHYLGFTGFDVDERIATHRSGRGARLIQVLLERGGDFQLALRFRVPLDRARTVERALKNDGSSCRICPLCVRAAMDAQNERRRARRTEAA